MLELMIAMSVFAAALQLTMRTHLLQASMLQQIGRHRMALRALEARSAVDDVRDFARVGRRAGQGGSAIPAASDEDAIVALADALTVRLPSPQWIRTRGEVEGNGWTVCWRESRTIKSRIHNDMVSEIILSPRKHQQEGVDAVRCESLALP